MFVPLNVVAGGERGLGLSGLGAGRVAAPVHRSGGLRVEHKVTRQTVEVGDGSQKSVNVHLPKVGVESSNQLSAGSGNGLWVRLGQGGRRTACGGVENRLDHFELNFGTE